MQRIAYPFLRLSEESIDVEDWMYRSVDSDPDLVSSFIRGWDYQQDFVFSRILSINWNAAAESIDIPGADMDIALFVRVGTGNANLPRLWVATYRFRLGPESSEIPVVIDIPGSALSGKLFLETSIVLVKATENKGSLSPAIPSACLWQDVLVTRLEDDESRFPIEAVPFSSLSGVGINTLAPWYLNFSSGSPHRDFTSAVRLFVNTENKDFFRRIEKQDRLTLQQMLGQVMDIISREIIMDDEVVDLDVFESGSVGQYVASWMDMAFPEASIYSLRSILNTSPGRFASMLLAVADPGEPE